MLNIRSLVNKLSRFQSFVYTFNFCIICITETWLSDYICDGEILPAGYILYRKDRPSRGGGVLIAVKESLFSCIIQSPPDLKLSLLKLVRVITMLFVVFIYLLNVPFLMSRMLFNSSLILLHPFVNVLS